MIILIAVALIAVFGVCMHLIETRGLLDEQFGDSGDWAKDKGEGFYLYLDEKSYACTDDIDTYLFIGTDDAKEGEDGFNGEMADFLMLVIVNNTTGKYGMYQIDRNTMTYVDILDEQGETVGSETQQITISHWYGQNAEQRNANTVRAVSNLFGELPIENYFTLNMKDIGMLNNAVGGVTVDIPTDMTVVDPAFTAGSTVTLTDEQAEKFVRARQSVGGGTNKERMERQRQYIQSLYEQLMSDLRERPEYVNDLYDQLHDVVQTDSDGGTASVLANQVIVNESEGIITFSGTSTTGVQESSGDELEEFYPDGHSLVDKIGKVLQLTPVEEGQE